MALGADSSRTVGLVVRNSLVLIAMGGAGGLAAAIVLTRWMEGILYGIGPFDLPSFGLAALALLAAGVLASLQPALRATSVDPIEALRES
jgi:ABC-type antimicrobial peptide transport system permease subunit